jgi:hypothetical protein
MNKHQGQFPPPSPLWRGSGLFFLLLLLAGAAGAVLVVEGQQRGTARAEQFQRLMGGVGFGPAVDLSVCAFGFDPRLDGDCALETGPVPGGACFCPRHAGSVFFFPPLEGGPALAAEGGGDGLPR